MTVTKEELDKIFDEYHSQDTMADKFIEDECQYYTYGWVFRHIGHCKEILELGYGEGNFTEELVKRGFQPTVLEGSAASLQRARSFFGDKIKYAHDLFEEYDPEQAFDCILATHVLEHVDDPVLLLKRMRKWLAPNGKIIIIVPNKESIHRQLAVIMKLQPDLDSLSARDKVVGHQRVYSLDSLAADVEKSGMKVIESEGFFLKTLPNSMMLSYSIELVRALSQISPLIPRNLLANIGLVAQDSQPHE